MAEPTVRISVNVPPDIDAQLRAHLAYLRATRAQHQDPITVTAFLVRAIQGQIEREQQ